MNKWHVLLSFHIHTSDNKIILLLLRSPPTQYVFSKITVYVCLRINRIVSSRLDSQLRIFLLLRRHSYQQMSIKSEI